MAKKKSITVLAIDHSKRVCDPLPELIDRMEVRRLVISAYRAGYNKSHGECMKRMVDAVDIKLSDIDAPIFTHSKEFKDHFIYVISKIKDVLFKAN